MRLPPAPMVEVHEGTTRRGASCYALNLATSAYNLTINIPPRHVPKLLQVESTPWRRGTVRIGTLDRIPAFWCSEEGTASILFGDDDQAGLISIHFPVATLRKIIREIEENPLFE